MVQRANEKSERSSAHSGPEVARRRSIRLESYDYASSGAYFLTICTAHRKPLFGRAAGGRVIVNRNAKVVRDCWLGLPDHYAFLSLDAFVVMPDHVHGIVVLEDTHRADSDRDGDARAGLKPAPTDCGPATYPRVHRGLPEVVRALKTFSARRINALRDTPGTPVWQRGYYERIIRSEHELNLTRRYIETNPQRWQQNHETTSPQRKTNPS